MPALSRTINQIVKGQVPTHQSSDRKSGGGSSVKSRVKRGFTLIELLVVITIIGILVAIAIASFATAGAKARDSRRKADLDAVKKALELAKSDTTGGFYPGCPAAANTCPITTATNFSPAINPTYIASVPQDPSNTGTGANCGSAAGVANQIFCYEPTPAGCTGGTTCTGYTLSACLENNGEAVGGYTTTSATECTTTATNKWYRFNNP